MQFASAARIRTFSLALILLLGPGSFEGQSCHGANFEKNDEPQPVPARILTAPIGLINGLGKSHETVTTRSRQAQAYYDQGLAYLTAYDWIHAARSFNQALHADPAIAMAYLGLSYAYSGLGEDRQARAMVERAIKMGGHATSRERLRIELRLKQLRATESSNEGPFFSAFVAGINDALRHDPTDLSFLLMRGIAAEGYSTAIGQRGGENSILYYQKMLKIDPGNISAHHFLIHAFETTNNQPEAFKEAETYQRLSPSAAHAHHMFGHELRRTKQLREAIAQFERADQLERQAYRSEPESLFYDWNYRHNLNLLASTYAQAGLTGAAMRTYERLVELPSMSAADELYRTGLANFLLLQGKNKDAIRAVTKFCRSRFTIGRVVAHIIRGTAAARLKDARQASKELLLAEKEASGLDSAWTNEVIFRMETLRAQVDLLTAQPDRAAARLRSSALRMRVLPGADAWAETMFQLQLMDEIAIESGAWDLASFIAEQLVNHAPHYIGSHLLLARIAEHAGDAQTEASERQVAKELKVF